MSGRQMSQTAKYQGAKCLGREMSLPPIVWGTYCPGSQISGRQMSQRQLSGADRRAPNVRQPCVKPRFTCLCDKYFLREIAQKRKSSKRKHEDNCFIDQQGRDQDDRLGGGSFRYSGEYQSQSLRPRGNSRRKSDDNFCWGEDC